MSRKRGNRKVRQRFKSCCGLDVRDPNHKHDCSLREQEGFTQWVDPRRANKLCCGIDTRDPGHTTECRAHEDGSRKNCCGTAKADKRHQRGCYADPLYIPRKDKKKPRGNKSPRTCNCRTSKGVYKKSYTDHSEARYDAAALNILHGKESADFYECPTQENVWHVTSSKGK